MLEGVAFPPSASMPVDGYSTASSSGQTSRAQKEAPHDKHSAHRSFVPRPVSFECYRYTAYCIARSTRQAGGSGEEPALPRAQGGRGDTARTAHEPGVPARGSSKACGQDFRGAGSGWGRGDVLEHPVRLAAFTERSAEAGEVDRLTEVDPLHLDDNAHLLQTAAHALADAVAEGLFPCGRAGSGTGI